MYAEIVTKKKSSKNLSRAVDYRKDRDDFDRTNIMLPILLDKWWNDTAMDMGGSIKSKWRVALAAFLCLMELSPEERKRRIRAVRDADEDGEIVRMVREAMRREHGGGVISPNDIDREDEA